MRFVHQLSVRDDPPGHTLFKQGLGVIALPKHHHLARPLDCPDMNACGLFAVWFHMLVEIIARTKSASGAREDNSLCASIVICLFEGMGHLLDEGSIHR